MQRLALTILLLAAPAFGQAPPSPEPTAPVAVVTAEDGGPVPTSVAPGSTLVLRADSSVGDLQWQLVEPSLEVITADTGSPDGKSFRKGTYCIVSSATTKANPGVTLRFALVASGWNKYAFRFVNVPVTVPVVPVPPTPAPDDPPGPTPKPDPPAPDGPAIPAGSQLCVSYIFDPAARTNADLVFGQSAATTQAAALASLNAYVLSWPGGQTAPAYRVAQAAAAGVGLPAYVIQNAAAGTADYAKVYEAKSAKGVTSDQVVARLKALRGSK